MSKFQLVLLIHGHQPVGNFDHVFEQCYQRSYLPFVGVLEKHPSIRVGMHYTGPLLEWLERTHPEYFGRLKALVGRGQAEMVGGGFYEPILISIPLQDRVEQIERLAAYVEKHFGARPRGAWLAERVWEPQIPSSLAAAGVEYTLVDDNHFLGGGFEPEQLYGHYIAEDLGKSVKLLAGSKHLRYLIPFREPHETIEYLRNAAAVQPGGFATMGDDLEKFGGWPETHDHCYTNGWLTKFFSEIEANGDWLEVATPGEAVRTHASLGRADLPTASYTEMMEWALPTKARQRYHALVEEFSSRPAALPFLRGGIWRNFFSKYSESNLLQKKMMLVSGKLNGLLENSRRDKGSTQARAGARTLLLKAQCNDAYWHGVFGGLYSPHLRTALWNSLVESETIADKLSHKSAAFQCANRVDLDGDGQDEIYFTSNSYAALVKPADGGTMPALDFRTRKVTLVNSLMRRPEGYHAAVRAKVGPGQSEEQGGVASIHEQRRAKEDGLERLLNYDRWPRNTFRLLLFGGEKTLEDYAAVRLDEDAALAGGKYRVDALQDARLAMTSQESSEWCVEKALALASVEDGFTVTCDYVLKRRAAGMASVYFGIETVVNFLAPASPDRYFQSDGKKFPLRWTAAVQGAEFRVVDEWQHVGGSQVLAVTPLELGGEGEFRGRLTLHVKQI